MIGKIFSRLFLVCLVLIAAALLLFPQVTIQGAELGLKTCANAIIPSLFPFFVVVNLFTSLGYTQYISRSCLLMGLIGGYPLGAQTIVNQYQSGFISKDDAQRMILYCNNAGPAFIFGVAGYGVFRCIWAGLALYLIHAATAWILALFLSGCRQSQSPVSTAAPFEKPTYAKAITGAIRQSGSSIIVICVFITFFSILCTYFQHFLPPGCRELLPAKLLLGSFELAGGISLLSSVSNQTASFCLISFLLGFGGLCVTFQTCSILDDTDLSAKLYLPAKLLHGLLSMMMAAPVAKLLRLSGEIPIHRVSCLLLIIPVIAFFILKFLKESTGNTSCHRL